MDFVTDLPESEGCRDILVITDRLTRGVILEGVTNMTAETLARTVIQNVVGRHGFPRTITSDRGTQFVGELWSSVCKLANITKRLSIAYHP
jgi:transposase InsO family protein